MAYGWQTRSWRHSTEKRQTDAERADYTAKYLADRAVTGPKDILTPVCTCRSFNLAHDPKRHKELRSEMDWRTQAERGTAEYWPESVI